jgi:predicted nucleic acid-binding protein
MAYLVDANVLCESSRKRPDPKVVSGLRDHDRDLHLSALSLGEVLKGVHLLDPGDRRDEIERLYRRLERWSAGRLLSMDLPVFSEWVALYARHQRAGRKPPLMDSFLAATALHHGLTVVTRNVGDFPPEVTVLDPWR